MSSSDEEEGEIGPECVDNYHLVNSRDEPIPFTVLPLHLNGDEIPYCSEEQVFLRGSVDGGLRQIYKQVIAWKFDLSYVKPEILVVFKKKKWIRLQSPRKSYESMIRTNMVTVYLLHFIKRNPEATGETVWNHLKSFSSSEIKPYSNDLLDHIPLIRAAVNIDEDLKKSVYLSTFLLEKPLKIKLPCEDDQTTNNASFINDEDEDDSEDSGDEEDDDIFYNVCAICDNGGLVLSCEGKCMRSFHANTEAGVDSHCESLGYSDSQVEALPTFLCKNCQYMRHQCYLCGKLGSSDKSSAIEVFPCVSATCGHFYHPECVARKIHPDNEAQAKVLQNEIAAGGSFTCPAHKCHLCKEGENKSIHELQFAVCRRCPKAYHRKCLPKRISDITRVPRRAWEGLLPNRVLIYCMDHTIITELGTPVRDHCIFPKLVMKRKNVPSSLPVNKARFMEKRPMVSERCSEDSEKVKILKQAIQDSCSAEEFDIKSSTSGFPSSRKPIICGLHSKPLNDRLSGLVKPYKSLIGDEIKFASENIERRSHLERRSHPVNIKQGLTTNNNSKSGKPALRKESCSPPLVDPDLKRRMESLIEITNASFDEKKFLRKFNVPSMHAFSAKQNVDKITQGKVDASVKAIRTALKKLEEGGSVEDAKAVCDPQILKQVVNWKNKLKVYLAPFLHGMRYTSFGRHFTKVEKLEEIVERLHWYVQTGDTVVDFCCGANDFSFLMKRKLDKLGKQCSFKNYDLLQPKNDFCFEKRDWMSVNPTELPAGSQLIMGLNPPFGKNGTLANKFIDKALQFKPKLIILIVPEETKRLDTKRNSYDLIWEDKTIVSGKSFYLPGSIDVHDKQLEQWNVKSPPLYLWSRNDWTASHKKIAKERCHVFNGQQRTIIQGSDTETNLSNYLMQENHDCYNDFSHLGHGITDISRILDDVPEVNDEGRLLEGKDSPEYPSENLNEMQCDWKKQKDETSLGRESDRTKDFDFIDMEFSSAVNSPLNCNLHNPDPNIARTETVGSNCFIPNTMDMETVRCGGLGLASSNVGNDTLMNMEATSTEKIHESSSQGELGGILPYQYPSLRPYSHVPFTPYTAYGYPDPHLYNANSYTFPHSAVYNTKYNYTAPVYEPTMYSPTGYVESGGTNIRPPGVTASSNYLAPTFDYRAPKWLPSSYTDPDVSNVRPPTVPASNLTGPTLGSGLSSFSFRPGQP